MNLFSSSARAKQSGLRRFQRRIATGVAVLFVALLAYHVVFGRNGIDNYEHKRAQDKALQQQIDSLKQENTQIEAHVTRLKKDPDAIEYEAREKLHYARPGEVIYKLNNRPQPASGNQSTPPGH